MTNILFGSWEAATKTAAAVFSTSLVAFNSQPADFIRNFTSSVFSVPANPVRDPDDPENVVFPLGLAEKRFRARINLLPYGIESALPMKDETENVKTPMQTKQALMVVSAFAVVAMAYNERAGMYVADRLPTNAPIQLRETLNCKMMNPDSLKRVLNKI